MREYSMETLRGIILETIGYRKCPLCEGTGYQNWDEEGNDIKSGRCHTANRCNGPCDNCEGLGFILLKQDH